MLSSRRFSEVSREETAAIARVDRRDVRLGLGAAVGLLLPTLVGLIVGRQLGAPALSLAVGCFVGVLAAATVITRSVLARYADLAPRDEEPTGEQP